MTSLEIISLAQKRLANCMLELAAARENLECISSDDSDYDVIDIRMDIDEGACKIGFALAALTDWRDSKEHPENV